MLVAEVPALVVGAPVPSADAFIRSHDELAELFKVRRPRLEYDDRPILGNDGFEETAELPRLWLGSSQADAGDDEPETIEDVRRMLQMFVVTVAVMSIPFAIGVVFALRVLAEPV